MKRVAILALGILAGACASAPSGRESPPPREDRTEDPEFAAAREEARPEFETQADALAAGVYEEFVHPDSVRPARGPDAPPSVPTPGGPDPTTEELLGTLGPSSTYNPLAPAEEEPTPAPHAREAQFWTLQMGAYSSETRALVRIRQLERDFPDDPRWYEERDGAYLVFLGRFGERTAAGRARDVAAARGYSEAWVTRAP